VSPISFEENIRVGFWLRPPVARIAIVVILSLASVFLVRRTWESSAIGKKLARAPGEVVPDFALRDVRTGQLHRLSDHESRVVVIVFCGTNWRLAECYMPRLAEYSLAGESRGVEFVAINSNASETIEAAAQQARTLRATFPVLRDPNNRVADLLGAEQQGESLVIDRRGRLRYRGIIDDQFSALAPKAKPVRHYLLDAIDAVIADKTVSPEMMPVSGSPIERAAPKGQP
jgi:peroxiredoxin